MELLGALSRSGVVHYKSLDLEIKFGAPTAAPVEPPKPGVLPNPEHPAPIQTDEQKDKIQELIDTMKMDDESLLDKIFPAGA